MGTTTPAVQEFFNQYARSRTAHDIDLIASQYPDSIMFAGPNGTRVVEKPAIVAAFPQRTGIPKSTRSQIYKGPVPG
jgi:hypothetical protein